MNAENLGRVLGPCLAWPSGDRGRGITDPAQMVKLSNVIQYLIENVGMAEKK